MRLRERNFLVQAFKMPLLGEAADEVPPKWMIERMQAGDLVVNGLGGLTFDSRWGRQQCAAGDIVLLSADDSIIFMTPSEFARYQPPDEALPQAA